MYEVMARRYRPGAFDEVIGQEHIAATLKNAISRDRVAHAYLFAGGHGCGKTTMARILAKALVCEKGPTSEPCRQCPICRDVAAGRDSDVLEIDGASNNGIEQIRQLREQAAYVPTRARYKIYIIDEAHMLSDSAFNALLKTLEEPPRHVKFILATTDPHKLPDTILSRCQRFDFRLVPQPQLAALFKRLAGEEKAAITDEALDAVAASALGSVRDGLVLLDQLLSFADGEVTREDVESVRGVASAENVAGLFAAIARSDVAAALAIVDQVASRGTSVGDFLDQLVSFGRDLMILAATGSPEGTMAYGPARAALLEMGGRASLETALLYLDVLTQARTRVRSRALSNPLVALEMAVARLAGLGGVTPLADIIARLGNLPAAPPAKRESRAAPPPPAPAEPMKREEHASPRATEDTAMAMEEKTEESAAAPRDSEAASPSLPEEAPPPPAGTVEPAEAPEPAALPAITGEAAAAKWNDILDRLSERHPADIRHMARISLDGVKDGALVLSGPPTAVEAWEDRHRRARLAEAIEAILGQPIKFVLAATAIRAAAGSGASAEARAGLIRHPAVDRVRTLFDGVIVNCETPAPGTAPDEGSQEEDSEQGESR